MTSHFNCLGTSSPMTCLNVLKYFSFSFDSRFDELVANRWNGMRSSCFFVIGILPSRRARTNALTSSDFSIKSDVDTPRDSNSRFIALIPMDLTSSSKDEAEVRAFLFLSCFGTGLSSLSLSSSNSITSCLDLADDCFAASELASTSAVAIPDSATNDAVAFISSLKPFGCFSSGMFFVFPGATKAEREGGLGLASALSNFLLSISFTLLFCIFLSFCLMTSKSSSLLLSLSGRW
mmetsp:Transcript_28018/g.44076  ORF Transcript_28018/g.44076 Transcript_28018/m.44076 type:complete len:235 (+) Transcript_28018:183-887(+)